MILQCIEWALRDGCKINLSDAIRSNQFQRLRKKQDTLFECHPADSDQGVALRAGHLVMGELLNTMSETEAFTAAKSQQSQFGTGIDCRAMIEFVGLSLIEVAQKCLPDEVRELANEWQNTDAEGQIRIAHKLFHVFRSETQEAAGDLTMAVVWEKMTKKVRCVDDERCILPGLYGIWDKDSCPANCQGKAQMLTAFARLADVPVMLVSPLRHARRELSKLRRRARDIVESDLSARGLADGDASLAESLRASYLEESIDFEDHFHVGVALQLKDGRWVLIDPHGMVWGIFPDEWSLSVTYDLLSKYGEVLPGLQLIAHDHGHCKEALQLKEVEFNDILERSRKMEERIRSRSVESVHDLARMVVADSDDLDLLLRHTEEAEGRESPSLPEEQQLREYFALVCIMGGPDKLLDCSLLLDPTFHERRIKGWLTWYHTTAINLLGDQLNEAGELLHSVCEFGRPEYHLAVAVLNSLAFRISRRDSSVNRFFLDYSFDQVTLYNALSESCLGGDHTVAQAAGKALKALPFVHVLCDWRLRRL